MVQPIQQANSFSFACYTNVIGLLSTGSSYSIVNANANRLKEPSNYFDFIIFSLS